MSNGGLHASIAFYFKKEISHCLKPFWKILQNGMVVNILVFEIGNVSSVVSSILPINNNQLHFCKIYGIAMHVDRMFV